MGRHLKNFQRDRDRNNLKKASQLFDLLWPDRRIRIACAKRLAQSIRVAHDQSDASWSVSMFGWGVRLNVGQVASLSFSSNEVVAIVRTPKRRYVYSAVRVRSAILSFDPQKIATISRREWDSHDRFIKAAASAKKRSPFKASFSEGVMQHVEKLIGVELPRPSYQSRSLHILQGGVDNGDKAWLEKAAKGSLRSPTWIAPKSVRIGDEAVIYVRGYGFFATAWIAGAPKPRADWANRYGAALDRVELIRPPISLVVISKSVPKLKWAKYPRSITTLAPRLAMQVKELIKERRTAGIAIIDNRSLFGANIEELRSLAIQSARTSAKGRQITVTRRERSQWIHHYVLRRASGNCEGCDEQAPFRKADGEPYLEPHHTKRLADDGPDHPATVIALCPNCHRHAHSARDMAIFNQSLIKKLVLIEPMRK
jgi:hypothetical protein